MSVLVNGHIQKEQANGVVPIPFGSEYVLRFRNKNARRAVVKFFIDGENVSGNGYIIPSNNYVDIKRHAHKDVAFKFVELDSEEAHDHGKNGENLDGRKGVIEARFYLGRPAPTEWKSGSWNAEWPVINNPYVPIPDKIYCCVPPPESLPAINFGPPPSITAQWGNVPEVPLTLLPCIDVPAPKKEAVQRNLLEGCTVEGKASGQTFRTENIELETDYVGLRVVLKGFKPEEPAQAPAAEGEYCTHCGAKKARKTDNFCGRCGSKYQ